MPAYQFGCQQTCYYNIFLKSGTPLWSEVSNIKQKYPTCKLKWKAEHFSTINSKGQGTKGREL